MDTLEHRGMRGSVEHSAEDGCMFGRLQETSALVNYEGKNLAELTTAFQEAVDEYLADVGEAVL